LSSFEGETKPTVVATSILPLYLFAALALLYGLPLLTAGYALRPRQDTEVAILAYLLVFGLSFEILRKFRHRISRWVARSGSKKAPDVEGNSHDKRIVVRRSLISALLSSYTVLSLATIMVGSYVYMRITLAQAYPYPPSGVLPQLAAVVYLVTLMATSIIGIPKLLTVVFPRLRTIYASARYRLWAIGFSVAFAFVYLILVEQIIITGYNSLSYIPPPGNAYPFGHVFLSGPPAIVSLIYLPYILLQVNATWNFLILPWEMFFAILLGILVGTSVAATAYITQQRSTLACKTGVGLSGLGSLIGLTATCPTCLVPTLVSVLFGGIVSAEAVYSNLYGAVIPPVVSIIALLASLLWLSRYI
jgi:hypothetical protein